MRIHTQKFFLAGIFFLCVTCRLSAQVNSPYSRIGLGNIFPTSFTASNGMGQLTAAQFTTVDIQYDNPASYSYLYKSVFDVGAYANFLKLKTSTEEFNSGDGNLSYFAFGFSPDNKKTRHDFGFSTGLIPYSGFQYNIEQDTLDAVDTLIGTQSVNYRGTGSLYRFYGGLSYNIDIGYDSIRKSYNQNLGAGINVGYIFGNLQNITVSSFPEAPNSFSTKYIRETQVGGAIVNAGLAYQVTFGKYDKRDIENKVDSLYTLSFGVGYSPATRVDASQSVSWFNVLKSGNVETIIDTLLVLGDTSATITIPASFNIGMSFNNSRNEAQKKTKYSIGIEYQTTMWSQFEGFQYTDSMANSYRLKFGGEITPLRNDKTKKPYTFRAGFYTGKSNLVIQDEQLNEFGITLGMALPVRAYLSRINIALAAGRRGATDIVQENYFNFSIGMNLNDLLWFQRRQQQ